MTISPLRLACPPRFGTARNLDRPTLGPAVGHVARMLGKPFMPWQQYVADVVLELDESGRLAYDEFRITVPRQSGKSTWVLAKAVHRASATDFFGPRQRIVYTAQTRKDARNKFEEDFAPDIETARRLKAVPHWGNGNEHIRFPNRSRFGIESTTEKAGHGGTLDEAYIDEAFAQVDGRLEQAFGPAMITRRNTQTGVISTAGWENASPYLEAKVEHGRRLIEAGEPSRVAYFEWSAPQEADPYDRAVWRACMPALGYTIDEDAIAAELVRFESSPEGINGFRRAYLNQWVPKETLVVQGAIPMDDWAACAGKPGEMAGQPSFALEVALDQSSASLLVSFARADGKAQIEVVEHRRGTDWLVGAKAVNERSLRQLCEDYRTELVFAGGGPVESVVPKLEQVGVPLNRLARADVAAACGAFLSAVKERTLVHLNDPILTAACEAARLRAGESTIWTRKGGEDISPLYAATLAVWRDQSCVQAAPSIW